MDLLAYEAFPGGAPLVAAPLIFKDYRGWSTSLAVQNLGTAPTTVQVTYADASGATWSESATVAPLAAASFSQARSSMLPSEFLGSARIQSSNGQPLATVVTELHVDGSGMAYPGLTGGGERLNAPLVYKQYNGWDTGIQLHNLSPVGGTVVIRYPGTGATVESVPISPFGSATVYQPANVQLPPGFAGSASIQGPPGSRLVGIVNHVKRGTRAAMNYTIGIGPGAPATLGIPLVASDAGGWTTGVQLQQTGVGSSQVQVTFYREDGELALRVEETLPSGGLRTFYPPALARLGAGFRGSALVQTLSGPPPVVVVNEMVR
jgi:hypothetical protein